MYQKFTMLPVFKSCLVNPVQTGLIFFNFFTTLRVFMTLGVGDKQLILKAQKQLMTPYKTVNASRFLVRLQNFPKPRKDGKSMMKLKTSIRDRCKGPESY